MSLYFSAHASVIDKGVIFVFVLAEAAFGPGEIPLKEVVLQPVGILMLAVDFGSVIPAEMKIEQ